MKSLLFLLLFLTTGAFAQDSLLTELNGIVISYKLTKLSEDDKKDNYLVVVRATNTNAYDTFYQAPKGGVNHFFITVTLRNVNKEVSMAGNESRLFTSDGKLYYLKPSGSVSAEKKFKIDKGMKPVLTAKFLYEMTSISEIR